MGTMSRDLRAKSAGIKSPVLLIAAPQGGGTVTKDQIAKRYLAQVEKIPNKTVVMAENSKHFVMYDQPEWMWQKMEEFLAGNGK